MSSASNKHKSVDAVSTLSQKEKGVMDLEEIKKLIALLNEEALTEIEVEDSERRIRLKREPAPVLGEGYAPPTSLKKAEPAPAERVAEPIEEDKRKQITSPIVGTFYQSSSPEVEPYVKRGDQVKKGQILCVIEAMKLMNEIESDLDGKLVEICVEDGTAVEFGETLFFIEPA